MRTLNITDFEFIKPLGNGGFSTVYLGNITKNILLIYLVRKKLSGMLYALKTLDKEKIKANNKIASVINERDINSFVNHPFIVSMHSAFQSVRIIYF